MLHVIFQRLGIPPDDILRRPPGVRAFIFASMKIALEAEERLRQQAERG